MFLSLVLQLITIVSVMQLVVEAVVVVAYPISHDQLQTVILFVHRGVVLELILLPPYDLANRVGSDVYNCFLRSIFQSFSGSTISLLLRSRNLRVASYHSE